VPTIELPPYQIEYTISHGRSRRYTYLRFRPDMTLEVVVPRGRRVDPESEIKARKTWVLRQLIQISRSRKILEDDRVLFGGSYLKVVFEQNQDREDFWLDRENGAFMVCASDSSRVRELVRRWFLRETSRYVVDRLSQLAGRFPKYRAADVREMGRWGYCTRDGRLSFSWQLIALPERLREYVIFHELTHLSVFNHSSEFRRRLEGVCPGSRAREKELDLFTPMASYLSRNL
jgi:predicted metal-dependent hydrolase